MRNFLDDHVEPGVFDPDAVEILVAAFDAAWQSIKASGAHLSDKQIELMGRRLQGISLNRLGTASLTRALFAMAPCFTWLGQI